MTESGQPDESSRAFLMAGDVKGKGALVRAAQSLDELALLADTAGLDVVGQAVQHLRAINPATYIGSGKVDEIRRLQHELGFGIVVFDDELSAAQLRNLENRLQVRVIDRTALILDIFALHARTREGTLQVELAQYEYRLPRLTRLWTHLSRQGVGGVGLRGPGETQLEMDRRDISRRISRLKQELEQVRRHRSQQRGRRRRQGMPVIAIVGYTNAGKSTLLNRISGSDVLVQDQLFATLDPTTRRVQLPSGKEALFTDTVGFIQKLPTQLVAAFRATLEEVSEADILVHVTDISDAGILAKVDAVTRVLDEIGAPDKPTILALNKVDLIDPENLLDPPSGRFGMRHTVLDELHEIYDHVVPLSAQQGVGVETLLTTVEDVLAEEMVEADLVVPYSAGDWLNLVHKQGVVTSTEYTEQGIHMRGKAPKWLLGMLEGHEAED